MRLPKCADGEACRLDSKGMVQRGMDLPTNIIRARSSFRAAVANAESQRDGLDQAGLDLPTSKRILEILVLLELPALEILYRIESSEFIEELVSVLPSLVPKPKLREYYECLNDDPEAHGFEELRDCGSYEMFKSCLDEDFRERRGAGRLISGDVRRHRSHRRAVQYRRARPEYHSSFVH